ncbi:MAG: tetratricopeptide repeat protein [Candidatus Omnitrophota bacterium]|nr:tetratricopeptide repeat protein [Candidatus Omnitrophota bacterium]
MRIALFLILMLTVLGADLNAETRARRGFAQDEGARYFNDYRYEKALEYFEKEIGARRDDAELWVKMAVAYYETGNATRAIESCKKALEIDPEYEPAYYCLVKYYLRKGYSGAAKSFYDRAMSVQTESAEGYYYIGMIILEFDASPSDAMPFFKKAIEADPGYIEAYSELARAYGVLGEKEEAKDVLSKAIRIDPYSSSPKRTMGELYHGTKEAIPHYLKALEIKPFDVRAHLLLAETYTALKEYEEAKNHCYEAINRNPYDPDGYYAIAALYAITGEHNLSQINMKKAVELYQEQGDQKSASRAAERLGSSLKELSSPDKEESKTDK